MQKKLLDIKTKLNADNNRTVGQKKWRSLNGRIDVLNIVKLSI
jgi:hypothetical protein